MTMAKHDRRIRVVSTVILLSTVALPLQAWAENWTITPAIGVTESWTDNALSSARDRKADFFTTVNPSLKFKGEGAKLDLGLEYNLAYDRYAVQNNLDGFRHRGIGMVKSELVEDLFFVDARGTISEQLITPTGAKTAGDRRVEDNQTRVGTVSVTPQLRHRFGSWAVGQASYRHDRTEHFTTAADQAGLKGSTGDTGTVGLATGENFSRVLLDYELENIHRETGTSVFYHLANTATGEVRIDREWGVLAHGGHDAINGDNLDGDEYSGAFYGGGLRWTPSPRTEARAIVGHRFGSLDVLVDARQRLGAFTSINLSHATGVSTEAQLIADTLGAVERDETGRFIDPFSSLDADPAATAFARTGLAFKQTTTKAALSHARERDTLSLTAALSTREVQAAPAAASTETTALTLGLGWTHRLTETITGTATLGRSQILDAATQAGENLVHRASLSLAWAMNPTLSSRFGYFWVDSQPEQGDGITENMLSAQLRKTF